MGIDFLTKSNSYYIGQESKWVKSKNAKDQKHQCITSLASQLTRCYQPPVVAPHFSAMINPQAGWNDDSRNHINGLAQVLSADEHFSYVHKVTLLCSEVENRYAADQLDGIFRVSINKSHVEDMLQKNTLPFEQWITDPSLVDSALLGKLLKDEVIASFPKFTLAECHQINKNPEVIQQIITKKLSTLSRLSEDRGNNSALAKIFNTIGHCAKNNDTNAKLNVQSVSISIAPNLFSDECYQTGKEKQNGKETEMAAFELKEMGKIYVKLFKDWKRMPVPAHFLP
ncbi:hypothetical protein NFB56_05390 [Yersinia ruckeri]|uniref:hypothetical protein n=1 Tax=Yersinia ruckeri TaxID=29486 RepID=UPI0011A08B55|nr:hypothetical protein [Yersinia ruckeri]EKN3346842.1 hypothetical protein [Yersinia ruckeri]ELM3747677.1 hypothetical protein [Yersinia ruckeri]MCK8562136.1 hypothetical protein [Yersinia ruckeri]MCW6548307.1 hypothetical protein [Yersinia ruckeri]MCW6635104.1 hypothetical protein [Yersinia ruckeri]